MRRLIEGAIELSSSNDAAGDLHWVRTGPRNTSTVVLIHAVGFDLTYWDRRIEALRSAYDVIAFDLPGHDERCCVRSSTLRAFE